MHNHRHLATVGVGIILGLPRSHGGTFAVVSISGLHVNCGRGHIAPPETEHYSETIQHVSPGTVEKGQVIAVIGLFL